MSASAEAPDPSLDAASHKSSSPRFFGTCVIEDVHGRPASRPLSLFLTPERTYALQRSQQQGSAGSFTSNFYDKEMLLSNPNFLSPDQVNFSDNSSNAPAAATAAVPSAAVGADAADAVNEMRNGHRNGGSNWEMAIVGNQRSGAASQSRNGHTPLANSISGLYITQSGIIIPPIQGIPQPKGLPAPPPVQYAKLKGKGKGKAGPKRSRLAVKGAFSNMTSVAVLQHVQPFQKKTRQVEAAGWSRLDFTADDEIDDVCADEENPQQPHSSPSDQMPTAPPAPLQHTASNPMAYETPQTLPAAAAATAAEGALMEPAVSHHSRCSSAASQTSLTPSEAAMVAAAWEEDAVAAASANQVQPVQVDEDDWDRAEEEAMRIRAQMLAQQQQQQRLSQEANAFLRAPVQRSYPPQLPLKQPQETTFTPKAPTQLRTETSPQQQQQQQQQRVTSSSALLKSDSIAEMAPYAVRTAASAKCSPSVVRAVSPQLPTPGHEVCFAHRFGSAEERHNNGEGVVVDGSDAVSSSVAAVQNIGATAVKQRSASKTYPVGFEAYAEKGKQRRAEAERAQRERAAKAAGAPLPSRDTDTAPINTTTTTTGAAALEASCSAEGESERGRLRRSRKMSVLPPPRGFEAFAQRGQALREEVKREEEQRQKAEEENCKHVPRINRRNSVSTSAITATTATAAAASRKISLTSTATFEENRGAAEAAAVSTATPIAGSTLIATHDAAAQSHSTVFDRLSKEAEQREGRRRQLEQKFTPFFVPQRVTAAAKAVSEGEIALKKEKDEDMTTAEPMTADAAARPRAPSRNVFEDLYSLSKKRSAPPSPADATGKDQPARAKSAHTDSAVAADVALGVAVQDDSSEPPKNKPKVSSTAAATPAESSATRKKSSAEVEQYIVSMLTREEERRARWAQQQVAKAAEEKERLNHPTLNPKTGELAERARARYRVREEQKRQQEAEEEKALQAQGQKSVAESLAQRQPRKKMSEQMPQLQRSGVSANSAVEYRKVPHANSGTTTTTPARRSFGAEFYEHQRKTEERKYRSLEQLRLQQAEEELRECTFRPRLNTVSEKMAQRMSVESYGIPDDFEGMSKSATSQEAHYLHGNLPGFTDFSCHRERSPFTSAHSRSLLHELRNGDTPTQGPLVQDRSSISESEEKHFSLNLQPIQLETASIEQLTDAITPQRSPEPLSTQLRNLEEMLREWKELERECSPMLRHRPQAGLVE